MRHLNHKINQYLEEYPIDQYFSFAIKPYLKLVEFSPNEYIFRDSSSVSELYYLIDGRAKLTLFESNGKSFINILEAPCFIGEVELLDAQEYSNEVCALTPCICFAIPLSDCKNQILSDARFLKHLCTYLSRDSLSNLLNYTRNRAFPVENRLAKFILQMSQDDIYREHHTEASQYLGVSYRHFLHVISSFCEKGILKKERRGYRVLDRNKLEELSRGLS